MSDADLQIFILDNYRLQQFFRQFATIKILASDTTVVENQDSFLIRNFTGRTPTSLGMTTHLIGSAGFKNKIIGEMRVLNERFGRHLLRTADDPQNMVSNTWTWLDRHVQHCRKYFITYSQHANELNEINRTMQRALGFGICAGAVAQAAAELALVLSGVGLPTGRLVSTVPITVKEIALRAALGFEIGYAIGVVEEWGKAKNADVMALNMKEGDALGLTGSYVGFGGDYLTEIAIKTNAERTAEVALRVKNSRMPALNRADKLKLLQKQQAATAGLRSQGKAMSSTVKGLAGLNYLLAIKGTYDALDKCVKHCSFEL